MSENPVKEEKKEYKIYKPEWPAKPYNLWKKKDERTYYHPKGGFVHGIIENIYTPQQKIAWQWSFHSDQGILETREGAMDHVVDLHKKFGFSK